MADPSFSRLDRDFIHNEVDKILSGSLSMGPNVKSFEDQFASLVGVKHAIAMNSCSSCLEASLMALGATGREVIVPVETFIATGMAIHLSGATPVFAEISEDTLCLDIDDVKRRITDRTAGIILVHMAGLVNPQICELQELCIEKDLFLIEDAAHAPGARYGDVFAGAFGNVGCFSFYPTKVITSAEGGMITTNSDELAKTLRSLQHRGRDLDSPFENYSLPGRNVRLSELNALVGRVQLGHLNEYLGTRKKIANVYIDRLNEIPSLKLILPTDLSQSSLWKIPIIFHEKINRQKLKEYLYDNGISVDWAYDPALHLQPVFKKLFSTTTGMLTKSESILSRHLCLPCHQNMSEDDGHYVCDILIEALEVLDI